MVSDHGRTSEAESERPNLAGVWHSVFPDKTRIASGVTDVFHLLEFIQKSGRGISGRTLR